MSKFVLTGDNGKTTTFNFKFDNGLPTKTLVAPTYDTGFSEEKNVYALSMYFTDDELIKVEDLIILNFYIFDKNNELWLELKNSYIVFENLSDKIIEEARKRKLIYCFFKDDETFIDGIILE